MQNKKDDVVTQPLTQKIIHISDTKGAHKKLEIEECDILIHTGNIGINTSYEDLFNFLEWFSIQKAKIKIFIGGEEDTILDYLYPYNLKIKGHYIEGALKEQEYINSLSLIKYYKRKKVFYLKDSYIIYNGLKIYGLPYTMSYNKKDKVFIKNDIIYNKYLDKIPKNTNILLSHSPPKKILDSNLGNENLLEKIKTLTNLKMCLFGGIKNNTDIIKINKIIYSNAVVCDEQNKIINNYGNIMFLKNE